MGATTSGAGLAEHDKEALLQRADEALHSLRASFADEASHQITHIETALGQLSAGGETLGGDERDALFETVFNASHEIKGQAGSFGYDLLTHVCDSLCHVVEARDAIPTDPLEAVRHHVVAARTIFDQDIKGDGGAIGVALLGELGRLKAFLAAATDQSEPEPADEA